MKALKVLFAAFVLVALASCSSITPLAATSNPLGTKCGEVSYPVFLSCIAFNGDASIQTAAKKAGITRISHIDVKMTSILGIYGTYTVYVWGE